MELGRRCDFHTHTFYSDGVLAPVELVRRAFVQGHEVIAITDHVDFTNLEFVLKNQRKLLGEIPWDIRVLVGVELTHLPKTKIGKLAEKAKKLNADIVVVHGESPVEPVEKGTNAAAVECEFVDILAHPGNITVGEAEKARDNDIYLELTTRGGHRDGNKRVADVATKVGAKLLVNTDAHEPEDLVTQEYAYRLLLELNFDEKSAIEVVRDNPKRFLKRI